MNKRLILLILGWVLIIEGVAMQIGTITSLIYSEHEGIYFFCVGLASVLLGLLAIKIKKPNTNIIFKAVIKKLINITSSFHYNNISKK